MSAVDSDSEVSDSEAEANYDPYYDESSEVSDSEAEASPDDMPEAESVVNFFGVAPPVRKEKPKKKAEKKEPDKPKEADKTKEAAKPTEAGKEGKPKDKKKKKSQRRRRAKKQFEEMQKRLKEQEEAKAVQHGDATERASTKPAEVQAAPPPKELKVVYRPCETCGKDGIKKCAACKKAYYCSYTCQSKDWKFRHKQVCKVLASGGQ